MKAIEVKNLSKSFIINSASSRSLKNTLLNVFGGNHQKLTVLDDISFDIKKGEFIGIIGQNGCGKSTLLKILANIISPDSGEVIINGKVSPFLELGVGFQEELSAIDNIYLYGSLLGMTKSQINEKLNDIISFSELEKFINTPLKHFSSGMFVRLAFSVAIHAEFDILLLDEVLAVGDYGFQQKCFQKFDEISDLNKTIVFVSHNMQTVSKFCDKCILIESGNIKNIGNPTEVIKKYIQIQSLSAKKELKKSFNIEDETVVTKKISINDFNNNGSIQTGQKIKITHEFLLNKTLINPILGISVYDKNQNYIFGINTKYLGIKTGKLNKGNNKINYTINQFLSHGDYYLSVAICNEKKTKHYLYENNVATFQVTNSEFESLGVVDFPSQITINKNV